MWRQSAPFVRSVLQGVLQRVSLAHGSQLGPERLVQPPFCPCTLLTMLLLPQVLIDDDVQGAGQWVRDEIWQLLVGGVSIGELAMTGGLWRLTGQQVEKAAGARLAAGRRLVNANRPV
jgi:hypothetical protein